MMKKNRKLPVEGKKIEKSEDKEWNNWFKELSVEEHEKMLGKLGFSKDELEEWEEEAHIKKEKKKK